MGKHGVRNKLINVLNKQKKENCISFNKNKLSVIERFTQKYIERDGHWLWIPEEKSRKFQNRFWIDEIHGRTTARRFSYEYYKTPILQDKFYITPICEIENCVNPEHLELKTISWKNKKYHKYANVNNCKKCGLKMTEMNCKNRGMTRRCIPCFKKYKEDWEQKNKEKFKETKQRYYKSHKDENRIKYKDRISNYHKKYYEENKDNLLEKNRKYSKEWYLKNKDEILRKRRKRYLEKGL